MSDKKKTKAQLIDELTTLRQQMAELETAAQTCKIRKQQLANENALLSKVIDISFYAIIILDDNQKIITFNQAAAQLFGYTPEDVIGQPLDILIPTQFRKAHHDHMTQFAHSTPAVRLMGERQGVHGRHKDGTQFPIEASIAAQKIDGEQYFSVTLRDITQRQQREKALSESERFFDNVFTHSPVGIVVTDFADNVLQINQKFTELFGYTLEDIPTVSDWFPRAFPDHGSQEIAAKNWRTDITRSQASKGDTLAREYEIVCKNGAIRYVELTKKATQEHILVTFVDITERKLMHEQLVKELTDGIQREALLQKSEERLQYALIAGNLALWEWNYKINKGHFSDSYFSMLGYAPEESAGFTEVFYSLLHPDDLPAARQRNKELANGQMSVFEAEFRMRTKSGGWRWVLSRGQVVKKDIKGHPHRVIGIHLDITKRKEAQAALQERQTELEQIFKTLPNALIFTDPQRRIVRINRKFTEIFGYQAEEVLHKKTELLYLNEEVYQKEGRNRYNLDALNRTEPYEIEMRRKNGDLFFSEIVGAKVCNSKGEMIGYLKIIRDLTEKKKMESEVEHHKILLQTIMDESNLVIYVKNAADLTHVWTSKRFAEVANVNPSEAQGKTNRELFGEELSTKFDASDQEVLAGNRVEKEESLHDGRIYWSQKFTLHLPEGDAYVCGISTDITARKRAEDEQLRLDKLESLGVLAGGIAHDFNNLLTGLYGNIELTKMFLASDHPALKYLDVAESSMESATKLTDQLLTFAKGGDPIKEVFALGNTISETALFSLRGSRVKLQLHIQPDLWLVEADKGQLSQVISNLVINAQQAMPTGGSIYITASNIVLDDKRFVEIEVSDEGGGIPPQYIDKIFDPYFSTKQTGSGLGLASSFSIVSKHNGRISVKSELNEGTSFTIHLPATEGIEESFIDDALAEENPEDLPTAHILVLDDEAVVREALGGMLTLMGHQVEFAVDGKEALFKYQTALATGVPYDLVVADLTIPGGMGGQEAAQAILNMNPDAKLIVSSGYATDPVMANYVAYGFKGIVVKPYQFATLKQVVQDVLHMS